MADLSILIPSRNEMFLKNTIENILANIEADTEIIAVMDGAWANPPIPDNDRVTLIYNGTPLGQRASTNKACKLSKAKYVMKVDAHCSFDKGFDVKMMLEMHDDWTMVPVMKNLHAFDWLCPEGHRRYQGPSGVCSVCGKPTTRDIMWEAKKSPNSTSYCFDSTPHFQYFGEYSKRPEAQGDITESMSLQGSAWMLTREKYWQLNICDENFGSWGSQGIEVAVKTWLSGGRVVCNHKTWYAHMFRTQGGDFSFPYPISGKDQEKAKKHAKELFFNNQWEGQIRPLSWLVERFWPVKGWTDKDLADLKASETKLFVKKGMLYDSSISSQNGDSCGIVELPKSIQFAMEPTKGIVYYTDHSFKYKYAVFVRKQLAYVAGKVKLPIVSVSLKQLPFGIKNIHFPSFKKGPEYLYKQILSGLQNSKADIVFLAGPDVKYNASHFAFTPAKKNLYYFNNNIKNSSARPLSAMVGYRDTLIKYFEGLVKNPVKNPRTPALSTRVWKSDLPIEKIKA